jgi:hypothetical protein
VHLFPNPKTEYSECDRIQDFLSKRSLSFDTVAAPAGAAARTRLGEVEIEGWSEAKFAVALKDLGYPAAAVAADVNVLALIGLVFLQVVYVTMVYGPIAAFLVELFPTRIRYTSMSFPYHIGNGWFGGMLPLVSTALVAANGNVYAGLYYPIIVAALSCALGALFIRETKDHQIHTL